MHDCALLGRLWQQYQKTLIVTLVAGQAARDKVGSIVVRLNNIIRFIALNRKAGALVPGIVSEAAACGRTRTFRPAQDQPWQCPPIAIEADLHH